MKTKNKGSIVQCADGSWMIDTKIKVGDKWLHFKRTGYATKADVNSAFTIEKEKFISSKTLNKWDVMTFEDLITKYAEMRKVVVSTSTRQGDASDIKVYMCPFFGTHLLVECFTADNVEQWYHELVNNPAISNSKKSKIITRMKDLLKFAYSHKYISAPIYQDCDVCLYQVKYIKKPISERVIWTKEEEENFWATCSVNSKDYAMFRVFFECSARLGEFLGLQVNCFNAETRKLVIKQQAVYVSGEGLILTNKLKTQDSYRTIILSENVANLLQEYIDKLELIDNDYLFFEQEPKKPISRTAFRQKLYKYCDLAGVRRMNPHASRHLQAVKLARVADSAEMIEAAARRLGHSPEMFLNTYAKHANDKNENELLKRLGEI